MENSKYFKECTTHEEILKQNKLLKAVLFCIICKDRKANRLFLPCAHLNVCNLCVDAVRNHCPKCNRFIRGIVAVYF